MAAARFDVAFLSVPIVAMALVDSYHIIVSVLVHRDVALHGVLATLSLVTYDGYVAEELALVEERKPDDEYEDNPDYNRFVLDFGNIFFPVPGRFSIDVDVEGPTHDGICLHIGRSSCRILVTPSLGPPMAADEFTMEDLLQDI